MLTLSFKRRGTTISLAPVEYFEFRGSHLFAGNAATPAAVYLAGQWMSGDEKFLAAECVAPISIQFVQHDGAAGLLVGPRHAVWLRDRFIFAGREPVARLDPVNEQWLDTHRWPIVRVLPYAPR